MTAAPNPVDAGAPLTYSLTVTNNSTNTATGVVVSDTLPLNVTFISALPSQGTASNQPGTVTFEVGTLSNGVSVTLAIVVEPDAAGMLTNTAVASSLQTDSQPTNNRAQIVTTAVAATNCNNLVLTVVSPIPKTCDPRTHLFTEEVCVKNRGPCVPSWVRVLVTGLAKDASLYNACGTNNGTPYVESACPLGVGASVNFELEYYVANNERPTVTLTPEAGPQYIPPVTGGPPCTIGRTIVDSNGCVYIDFNATPGGIYAIQYCNDLKTWRTVAPAFAAMTNVVQWMDAGPPQTECHPAQAAARYYRVLLLP
jgi:uncharacterized repeat protein (TIGR01451 family)